jgi:hypothetical protein
MHAGARGSGAQRGNQNRLLHGRYTRRALEQRVLLRLVAAANAALMADLRVIRRATLTPQEGESASKIDPLP